MYVKFHVWWCVCSVSIYKVIRDQGSGLKSDSYTICGARLRKYLSCSGWLGLAESYHVTWILVSDWLRVIT